jgi:glycerol-3-phosphate dehydrogenase (NAD(P)+)
MSRAVVIGAGSWGAAIASALQRAGQSSMVLARRQESVDALAAGRCLHLPDAEPAAPIAATLDSACLDDAALIFVAVPVVANQASFLSIAERQNGRQPGAVILCAKGISKADDGSAMLLNDLAARSLPDHPLAVFSGPSFADEVFAGLPAALVAASNETAITNRIQDAFEGSNLRLYSNDDPVGVALAGAMKNVIAIAAGCAVGAGFGDNAKAAILTRGLAEMARFASLMGAKPDTIFGLAGVGDLALTCAGPHSRNMAFGMALGRGETPPAKLAEGSRTVSQLAALAKAKGVDLPITNAVDKLVNHGQDLHSVVARLLARRAGAE